MVARVKLQQMRQDRDEPVRAFADRLRGQAGVCSFSIKCLSDTCGSSVDYSDIMIRDALIRGLDDEEIRLDILGESRQDLSLEDTLSYVEAKESGKRSASHLIGDSSINTAAAMSPINVMRKSEHRATQQKTRGYPPHVVTAAGLATGAVCRNVQRSARRSARSAQSAA